MGETVLECIDYCILGGGWAGVLSAYEILKREKSAKVLVLEKDSYENRGGLMHSETIGDVTFDTGGPHILFSRDKDILTKITDFLGDNVRKVERKTYIAMNDKFIDYPFENGIYNLEPEVRASIGEGIIEKMLFLSSNPDWKPSNFQQWIYGFFGNPMAEAYLEPYNRKIWKRDLSAISSDWVFSPGRLPFPELNAIIRSVSGLPSTGYAEQAFFYYPKKGGILALYDSVMKSVTELGGRVNFGNPVKKLSRQNNAWVINDTYLSSTIINTLPLNLITSLLNKEIRINQPKLDYNRVIVIGISKKGKSPIQHSVYVPDPTIIFHRYTWMNQLMGEASLSSSNLIAEVTIPYFEEYNLKSIERRVIDDLIKLKVLKNEGEVIFTRAWVNEYGYPIYDMGHIVEREKVFANLKPLNIFSVGRWGSWHYWNTDKVYEAVISMVRSIFESGVNQCQ